MDTRKPFSTAGQNSSRHVTARHLGFEHVPRPYFPRLHGVVNLSELPRTPGLLFVGVGIRNRRGDRFPVGHLRLTDGDVDAVGPLEDIHLDVEMKLTHALDDRFLDSSSVSTRKEGSSAIIFDRAMPSLSTAALSVGAMAMEITGSGNTMGSRVAGLLTSQRVWPVCVVFMPSKATMSPA